MPPPDWRTTDDGRICDDDKCFATASKGRGFLRNLVNQTFIFPCIFVFLVQWRNFERTKGNIRNGFIF